MAGQEDRVYGDLKDERNVIRPRHRAGGEMVMERKSKSVGEDKVGAAFALWGVDSVKVGAEEAKVFEINET